MKGSREPKIGQFTPNFQKPFGYNPASAAEFALRGGGQVCVCHLGEILGLVQPKVSRHLAYLKKAGLVEARREGKWIHYRWATNLSPVVRNIMAGLRDYMAKDKAMCRERAKIVNNKCE